MNAVIIELADGDMANIRIECEDESERSKLEFIAEETGKMLCGDEQPQYVSEH